MAKYIDADKLIAEIERLANQKKEELKRFSAEDYTCSVAASISCELYGNEEVLSIIKSLQQEQPKIDLEVRKQIEELANDWHHKGFASDEDCPLCMQDLMDILWHFYELGQKDAANKYDKIEYNRQRAEEEMSNKTLDEAAEESATDRKEHNPSFIE